MKNLNSFFTDDRIQAIVPLLIKVIEPLGKQLPDNEFAERLVKHKFIIDATSDNIFQQAKDLALKKLKAIKLSDNSDISSQVEVLNQIAQIFCLRSNGVERPNIEENIEVTSLYAETKEIMATLGFVDALYPKGHSKIYDIAFVYGAYEFRMEERLDFLKQLINKGHIFKRIVLLAGARPLDPKIDKSYSLIPNRIRGSDDTLTEFHMMQFLFEKKFLDADDNLLNFDLNLDYQETKINTEKIFANANYKSVSDPRVADANILSLTNIDENVMVNIVNGSALKKPGAENPTRPTTQSTIEDYLAYLMHSNMLSKVDLSVCSISMQPHTLQQALVAEGALPKNFVIEAVGSELGKTSVSDMLDNLARFIYQLKSNMSLQKELVSTTGNKMGLLFRYSTCMALSGLAAVAVAIAATAASKPHYQP